MTARRKHLSAEDMEEMRLEAERIEAQNPRPQTVRAPVAGGARTDVDPEVRRGAIGELEILRGHADQTKLDLHEAIAKWSKVIDVSDVAIAAGLPRRTDVYRIVRELPRLRRRIRRG